MATVLSEITDVMREILQDDIGTVTSYTCFHEFAEWDPADLFAIVVEAECRFGIQFELTEIDRLVTVGDLVRMVTEKQALTSA